MKREVIECDGCVNNIRDDKFVIVRVMVGRMPGGHADFQEMEFCMDCASRSLEERHGFIRDDKSVSANIRKMTEMRNNLKDKRVKHGI